MPSDVEAAYSNRAAEYVEKIGSVTAAHPSDRQLIASWAAQVTGPLLDAGCGPGQWTAYLAERGNDARGIDQVPEFIEHARRTHPSVGFELGSFDRLPDATGSVGGILAWYSLIHHEPATVRATLKEFARVLRPGSWMLTAFHAGDGRRVERTSAYGHPIAMTNYVHDLVHVQHVLHEAGFHVHATVHRAAEGAEKTPQSILLARR